MKKIIMVVLMLAMTTLYAQNLNQFKGLSEHNAGRVGVGLTSSNYYGGITAKLYLSDQLALQGSIASAYNNGILGSVDVIFEVANLVEGNKALLLPLYVGAGINFQMWNDYYNNNHTAFSFSGVVGAAVQLRVIPLEFSLELRPTIGNGRVNLFYGGAAVRWFF